MKAIQHVFFDLDHTLWDYDRSSKETLLEIYEKFEIRKHSISEKQFLNTFYDINDDLWHRYNIGEIDRAYIQHNRFKNIFEKLNREVTISGEVSGYFLNNCSLKPYLMPDALTALNYLEPKYELHIITNGFLDSQTNKIKSSRIDQYFKTVVTSECANSRKPSGEIFRYSLAKASALKETSIMIGDNPKTDISGARDFGLKTILYDPSQRRRSLADYSIRSLYELINLL